MKTVIPVDSLVHEFDKVNLVTGKDGCDTWKCRKCGLTGKRRGFTDMLQVNGKKSIIENCIGDTHKSEVNKNEIMDEALKIMEPKEQKNPEVLEAALAQIESIEPVTTDRDSFFMDIGVIKALNFSETFSKYLKARKLMLLLENKKYKELGLSNQEEVFQRCKIKPTTGKQLISAFKKLTDEGYKALAQINMKQRDINLLAKASPKVKTNDGKVEMTIAGETVEISQDNRDEIANVVSKLEKELTVSKARENKMKEKNTKLEEENKELLKKVAEQTLKPDKAYDLCQNQCHELLKIQNQIVAKLEKINEKYPELVFQTVSLMEANFLKLREENGDEVTLNIPEDSILD